MSGFENMSPILSFAIMYAALLFCISIHESAHALLAYLLGDETSKYQNRISINPLDHIDVFGTLIFPILAFFLGIPVIGWAKPVMVDPRNLRDPKRDGIFISAAGPASNILAAFILIALSPVIMPVIQTYAPLLGLFQYAILINVILAFFNLIPIPPLDGSGILSGFLPDHLAEQYEGLSAFGFILIYLLLLTGILEIAFGIALKFINAIQIAAGLNL